VIVLDSSFLVAFHNTGDVHHAAAARVMERLLDGEWGPALVPEYVFLEVVTVLRMRLDLPTAVSVGETLLRAREVELVPCSEVFLQAFDFFRVERGTTLSFADAAVSAVARRHPPGFVATFDADFEGLEGVTVVA
jgi:predicted nucleic acid-binding protein